MKKIFEGFADCFKAHLVIKKSGMTWLYFIPILFSSLMVVFIVSFAGAFVSAIATPATDLLSLNTPTDVPSELWDKVFYFLKLSGEYIILAVLYVVSYYIFFKVQKYIVLIFMAPVMAYASEKAEEYLLGNVYEFKFSLFLADIWRGVGIAIRNLLLELILILMIGLLVSGLSSFIPPLALVAAPVSAVLIFIVGAYYYGYSAFDYLNERHRLKIGESNRLIWDHKSLVTGNGAFFGLVILIPLIGITLASLWSPVGAVISSSKNAIHNSTK